MTRPGEAALAANGPNTWTAMDRWLRGRLLAQMATLTGGRLVVFDDLGSCCCGQGEPGETITLQVHSPRFYRAAAINGSVGAGESYIQGDWSCDNLVGLVQLLVRNRDLLDGMETGLARLGGWLLRCWHGLRRNTRAGARRNIAAHYDLGNDFFALFLSSDLMYSSALFTDAQDTLEVASQRKLERIAAKLQLQPGDRVLEIGSGWGGFALHAAGRHGCHVTTTTISREQYAATVARVAAAGLQERVTVLQQDFRDLDGRYDKLVSIEMVEAIGADNLRSYFATISRLLAADGLALVQAITIEDHRYAQALRAVDFIKRYVFPGSFIPSVAALIDAKTRASDLGLVHLEDFGSSYARTLQCWRERFLAKRDAVLAQGFDEDFVRLWTYYLAYCEGGFRERSIGVAQLLLAKPGCRQAEFIVGTAQPSAP
ncbi:MAG: class I SAM-dependent methyltransferase [Rhodanobacteraceae bacterium]|nr:class I SAM-dependent methyltransferase [Rhodanobacteraceae bacterium]